MDAERWKKIEAVFESALAVGVDERGTFLRERCAGDGELLAEVESLLAARKQGQAFFAAPVFDKAARLIGQEPSLAGQRLGNYEIIREIGHGGMGAVYLAARADDEYKKEVAIKLVRQGFDCDFIITRFLNERQILASLEHENIARLLDGGTTEDSTPYLVMEYVEGLPIDRYADAQKLSTPARLNLFRTVCVAVAYAHRNLVIHRDIKPSNILVTADGTPKLLDFGIAKLLDSEGREQTQTVARLMTPDYASPEQVKGEAITTASDVYSLGVLLYKLLTGHHPYRFKTGMLQEIERVICESEPERPSAIVNRTEEITTADGATLTVSAESVSRVRDTQPEKLCRLLTGDLDNIVLMAMRKEPERRYASVEQLAEDIRRHLDGLPVIARDDTFAYRATKFIRRHRLGVAAGVFVLISLIAGLLATMWQARVARAERDRATKAQLKAERINSFMQEALGSADPTKEGRDVKVIDVLEKASRRAESEFAEQPEVLADVRRTIGRTYYNLEFYDQAESLMRAAFATYQEIFGDEHPTTANCMKELGEMLAYKEKFDEAIPLLQKTVELFNRLPLKEKRDLASAKFALAQAFYFKGDIPAAEPRYREVLDFAQQNLSPDDSVIADVSNELANIIRENDYEAAAALYRQAIAIVRPLPEKRMDMATTLLNLGMVLMNAGRVDEAEVALRESLAIRREVFGDNSPSTASVMVQLSRAHLYRGDYQQAEKEARQALAIQEKTLPKGHRNLAAAYTAFGRALMKTGNLKEAEKYLRGGLDIYRQRLGAENRNTAAAESSLGECLTLQRRFAEAELLLKHSHNFLQAKLGDKDPLTIETARPLAAFYEAQGKKAGTVP